MTSWTDYIPAVFGTLVILLAFVFWIKSSQGTFVSFYKPSRLNTQDTAALGFAAIAFSFGITTILGRHFPHPERAEYAEFAKMMHDPAGLSIALFLTLIVAPFTEELFFRGLLINGFQKFWGMGIPAAVALSALFFAVSHTTTQLLSLLLFAGVLGVLRIRSQTLRTTTLTHFYNNALGMAMVYYDLPRPSDAFASLFILLATTMLILQYRKSKGASVLTSRDDSIQD
jgi:membrane protease YdiL (CAAX protease family)